jgi:hypothetical protein
MNSSFKDYTNLNSLELSIYHIKMVLLAPNTKEMDEMGEGGGWRTASIFKPNM